MHKNVSRAESIVLAVAILGVGGAIAHGQEQGALTRNDAVLVVDGTVREIFRSPRRDRVDSLVQIEVKRSLAERVSPAPLRVAIPAPGDLVYVHASERSGTGQQERLAGNDPPAANARAVVPPERSQIRAYLVPGTRGGWVGAGRDWFEPTSSALAEANPSDSAPAVPESGPSTAPSRPQSPPAGGKFALALLGLTGEIMNMKGQFVLRVSSVEQGGAAQRSGLEPGDIIIGANNNALVGLDQLDQLARQGALKNLLVLDVNTGKPARVPIDVAASNAGAPTNGLPPVASTKPETPITPSPPPAAGASRSLGISAEPVTVGKRTGMKVIRVEPGSPAQLAGIEPGDVLVSANGVPITGVEVLSSVVHKSGPTLTVTVRDTRTGRDVPVEIKIGSTDTENPTPVPADAPTQPGAGRKLGAVTELVFYDVNPAVKVTEVEPGSPAARAGIEPGDIIVEANGTPTLHPKTLDEVVRKSASTLKLTVIDPRTNKKTPVEVNLGGR
jgi:serine protease Do